MNECRKLHVQGGWQGSVTVADGKVEPRGTAGRNERVWTPRLLPADTTTGGGRRRFPAHTTPLFSPHNRAERSILMHSLGARW